ncbi:hypothetical protein [Enterococcus sp. S86.2]|uniref:hypothetical protein n=1 Tax=Enterococcus sp. S86.2 TaxID=3031299 RepID=UPI0026EB433E|nr:hypothetical protein [Enterococcus sp. S86.2]
MTKKERFYYLSLTATELFLVNCLSFLMTLTIILAPLCWLANKRLWQKVSKSNDVTLKMFLTEVKINFRNSLSFTLGMAIILFVLSVNFTFLQSVLSVKLFSVLAGMLGIVILALSTYWMTLYHNKKDFRFKDFWKIQSVTKKDIKRTVIDSILTAVLYTVSYLVPIVFFLLYTSMVKQISHTSNFLIQEKKYGRIIR